MGQVWSTSSQGIELIKLFEGCERKRPNGLIETYQVGADIPTIGWGQTGRMPDGRTVEHGLVISQQEADEALEYFIRNVVDPLVRKHFNCRSQCEHDAWASWVYNIRHDKLERGQYSLPELVNVKSRDQEALVSKWLQYCRTPGFENGLYRRRIAEVFMFLGLPGRVPAVWGYVSTARFKSGGVIDPTDPWFIIDVAERAQTTEDLNRKQFIKLGGKPEDFPAAPPAPAAKPTKAKKPTKATAPVKAETPPEPKPEPKPVPIPPTPNLDPVAPPKPMEDSQTLKGLSKADSGKETVVIGGTVTGIGALLPHLQAVTTYLEKFPVRSILYALAVVGIVMLIIGAWRWFAGTMIAFEGRQTATRPKV